MSKRFLFQAIQFSQTIRFSITITPSQSVLGSDGNKGVLRIPQSSSITGTSPSDCLVSYLGYSLGEGSYPSAGVQSVYSTAPADWANCRFLCLCACPCECVFVSVCFYPTPPPRTECDARYYLPTPPLGQDMTQGQFLSGV